MSLAEKVVRLAITWVITLAVPLVIITTAIRILLTPAYIQVEYRLPSFPPDPYGFTQQDRLHYGEISREYLLNSADISFLADQRLPDGQPLFNERELSHMVDVKVLVQKMIVVWLALLGGIIGLGLVSWGARWSADYRRGISRGGWLTVGLVIAVLVGVAASFNVVFTDFHRLFFTGNSWLFLYTDSLIRLFPIPFWRDAFILVGGLSLLVGASLGFFVRVRGAKRESRIAVRE